jgi:hypothetical protein
MRNWSTIGHFKKRIWMSIENPYALMLPTNYESIKITLRIGSQENYEYFGQRPLV